MNSKHTTESSKDLKNKVMKDINQVKEDFQEIKERMTPGQIIDDALFYRRGEARGPGETFAHLKENPVGTSFLTIGTLLLMEDEWNRSYEEALKGRIADVKESVKEGIEQFRGSATESSPWEGGTEAPMQEKAAGLKEQIQGRAAEAKAGLKEAKDKAKGRIGEASSAIKEKGQQLYESSKNLDPLTYLALGAGLGTLTGASLPISEKEQAYTDSRFEEKITVFGQELQDALNKSVNVLKNEFIRGATDIKLDLF